MKLNVCLYTMAERFEVIQMGERLKNLSSLALGVAIVGCLLALTACDSSPGEWEKEELVTEYGDRFEHWVRL